MTIIRNYSPKRHIPQIKDPVVVYDSLNQVYWKDSRPKYMQGNAGEFITIPDGKNMVVDLKVTVGGAETFLATIDLKKLGPDIKSRRRSGQLHDIYVLGQSPNSR